METRFRHDPVMVAEVLALVAPVPAGWFVDATVGGGGHAAAILTARPDLRLLGIDRDPAAVAAAGDALGRSDRGRGSCRAASTGSPRSWRAAPRMRGTEREARGSWESCSTWA